MPVYARCQIVEPAAVGIYHGSRRRSHGRDRLRFQPLLGLRSPIDELGRRLLPWLRIPGYAGA